jgi:hypothetical protein
MVWTRQFGSTKPCFGVDVYARRAMWSYPHGVWPAGPVNEEGRRRERRASAVEVLHRRPHTFEARRSLVLTRQSTRTLGIDHWLPSRERGAQPDRLVDRRHDLLRHELIERLRKPPLHPVVPHFFRSLSSQMSPKSALRKMGTLIRIVRASKSSGRILGVSPCSRRNRRSGESR